MEEAQGKPGEKGVGRRGTNKRFDAGRTLAKLHEVPRKEIVGSIHTTLQPGSNVRGEHVEAPDGMLLTWELENGESCQPATLPLDRARVFRSAD